jgi:hypothetical protein
MIKPVAALREPHKATIYRDEIICRIIREMRRLGSRLIFYNEIEDGTTMMQFEERSVG